MSHLTQTGSCLPERELSAAAHDFQQTGQQEPAANQIDAGLWQRHMLAGNFEEAWRASDRIRSRNTNDPQCLWAGESIVGKDMVIRSLHGLGDAVQMFQYAPQLKSLARSVTWQVPPRLVELASYFKGVNDVITWEQPCHWDLQIEITELPYLFRTTLPQLPVATRYLNLHIHPTLKSKPRIGLVWRAGEWNQSRSLPLAALYPILDTTRCDFVSLQGGPSPETHPRLNSIDPGLLSLATAIAQIDLVITVDTLAAHLAGALNIPAYVLLQYAADWRWMAGRDDSPWYPSLRLFRQPEPGDWETPLQAVREAIGTLGR